MAKKINLAERISEMVNHDAARTYIREHTLYPAVLLSGTRIGAEEKVRYRCAHCRHEWEETRSSSHWYHENHIVCPKCHATMFKGTFSSLKNTRIWELHQFYIWIFKNASPLGFMIEISFEKPVSGVGKQGIRSAKNVVQPEKNEVHLWFALFYDFLSKVLKMIFLSKWEGFGSFFAMIFLSGNAHSFKKFRQRFYTISQHWF